MNEVRGAHGNLMIFVVARDRRREREKRWVEMIVESDIDECCSCGSLDRK